MFPAHRNISILVLMIAGLALTAAASTPREEMIVRTTYAKAMLAYDIEQMSAALWGAKDSLAKPEHLQIDVSSVTVGPIQNILGVNAEDLVTKPGGYVLEANLVTADIPGIGAKRGTFKSLSAPHWNVAPLLAQNWAVPLGDDLKATGQDFLSRYASFDVRLTFMGRQRQYKALFLFGNDASGKEKIVALDFIFGISAINQLIGAPLQEEMRFLQEHFAAQPGVRGLLQTSLPQPGCEVESQSQLCCNPLTGHCGVQGLTPVTKLNVPSSVSPLLSSAGAASSVPSGQVCTAPSCSVFNSSGPARTISASGSGAHQTGGHSGAASAQGRCTYDGNALPCVPTCHVSIQLTDLQDFGAVNGAPFFYHQLGWDRGAPDGTNTCTGYVGFGGIQCLHFTACAITVSAGGGGVSVGPASSTVWQARGDAAWQCSTVQ